MQARTQQQMEQRERIPWIAQSLIVFDKTGQLHTLQEQARQAQPMKTRPEDAQFLQFMFLPR
ncbi:MAG TPA: hypothetical protein VKV40_19870 [Ktedonobacteraceae bacterium]|nr:hypothetical protein [Ktedonobacteraceae bacterium]